MLWPCGRKRRCSTTLYRAPRVGDSVQFAITFLLILNQISLFECSAFEFFITN